MSPQPKKPDEEPEVARAPAGEADGSAKVTPDAPAADVAKPKTKREEVVAATDAVDDVPDAAAAEVAKPKARRKKAAEATDAVATPTPQAAKGTGDEPAEKPAKPAARKRDAKPAAPARKANGKIARDKHGHPITTGPVVQAHAKYVRTSARKARLVCDHIRGKSVDEAVAILAHTPRAVAEDWEKLLKSAVANAEHNHELLGDDLKVHAVFADEGPTLKRFRPRAMGRATPIRKRTSHLTIQLTPKEQ